MEKVERKGLGGGGMYREMEEVERRGGQKSGEEDILEI